MRSNLSHCEAQFLAIVGVVQGGKSVPIPLFPPPPPPPHTHTHTHTHTHLYTNIPQFSQSINQSINQSIKSLCLYINAANHISSFPQKLKLLMAR